MGGEESRKSSSRHHFTRSHYFFICISFHYQSKSHTHTTAVAMSPNALAGLRVSRHIPGFPHSGQREALGISQRPTRMSRARSE